MSEQNSEIEISFKADTGEIYSLERKERRLVKEVLRLTLATPAGRIRMRKRFGKGGFKIVADLLDQRGNKLPRRKQRGIDGQN